MGQAPKRRTIRLTAEIARVLWLVIVAGASLSCIMGDRATDIVIENTTPYTVQVTEGSDPWVDMLGPHQECSTSRFFMRSLEVEVRRLPNKALIFRRDYSGEALTELASTSPMKIVVVDESAKYRLHKPSPRSGK